MCTSTCVNTCAYPCLPLSGSGLPCRCAHRGHGRQTPAPRPAAGPDCICTVGARSAQDGHEDACLFRAVCTCAAHEYVLAGRSPDLCVGTGVCVGVCVRVRMRAVSMRGTVRLCVHATVREHWGGSLCPCVAVFCTSPGPATSDSCRAGQEQPPAPPSLPSFIIICHEREPRRTVINKDHLKYETTTLTSGNISSVEQLVPPLSLWKGVPGATSPCRRLPHLLLSAPSPGPAEHLWSWRP